jgi:predicted ATPase
MFTNVVLENWRNFIGADVALDRRVFLVGPNASGKSNFLDAFRFLRDVAEPQGGFQRAVADRGTVSQIRSLHARRYSNVAIHVTVALESGEWTYRLEFTQDNQRRPLIAREMVWLDGEPKLARPNKEDLEDKSRLQQTHLEQVSANKEFRAVADFFAQVRYSHLIPLLVRDPQRSVGKSWDAYGARFLDQLARMQRDQPRIFDSRLKRILEALKIAVPQLEKIKLERDVDGTPHLRGLYGHWRPNAGWQEEKQFSDGTLRLMGLLWALLDGTAPLLLEEPELSLHTGVIRFIAPMMARINRKTGRQVIVSTHSSELLSDEGIPPEEVLMLIPTKEGTKIEVASKDSQIRALVEGGLTIGDAVLPRTVPQHAEQLTMFGE